MVILIQDIIYPILCIDQEEIELFDEEPIEFVRNRLGKRKRNRRKQCSTFFHV